MTHQTTDSDELFTIEHVAAKLNVPKEVVRILAHNLELKIIKLTRKTHRVTKSSLDDYLKRKGIYLESLRRAPQQSKR